ncbi:hypothetical protein H0H93_008030 [Arthromyces matolae]|nr:hypothetical protein H0H93_008030 [Arthromyces matolae]
MLDCNLELLRQLQRALINVGNITPLDKPSSAAECNEFNEVLHQTSRYIGQMHAHVSMLAEISRPYGGQQHRWNTADGITHNLLDIDYGSDSNNEDFSEDRTPSESSSVRGDDDTTRRDEEEEEDQDQDPDDRGRDKVASKRLSNIWPEEWHYKFYVPTLIETIVSAKKVSYAKAEDAGLERLLLGYHETTLEALTTDFRGMTMCTVNWRELVEKSRRIDEEETPNDRLYLREQFLTFNSQGAMLKSYASYVIRAIHMLKFQLEWNGLDQQAKTAYLDTSFEYLQEASIAKVRANNPPSKHASLLASLRKAFTKKYQRRTTARNYVVKLYRRSASPFKFGAGVFLDTVWDTPSDLSLGRSKQFGLILDYLYEDMQEKLETDGRYDTLEEYLQELRQRSRVLLRQVLDAANVSEVWFWVRDFLEEYPPD